jgi:hypothetical protein
LTPQRNNQEAPLVCRERGFFVWSLNRQDLEASLSIDTFARSSMEMPLDPDVADIVPTDSILTSYDHEHLITYLRLLDADADGADWQDVARIVLHIDPDREPDRAWRAFESHLSRAKWMTEQGYRQLLRNGG